MFCFPSPSILPTLLPGPFSPVPKPGKRSEVAIPSVVSGSVYLAGRYLMYVDCVLDNKITCLRCEARWRCLLSYYRAFLFHFWRVRTRTQSFQFLFLYGLEIGKYFYIHSLTLSRRVSSKLFDGISWVQPDSFILHEAAVFGRKAKLFGNRLMHNSAFQQIILSSVIVYTFL